MNNENGDTNQADEYNFTGGVDMEMLPDLYKYGLKLAMEETGN